MIRKTLNAGDLYDELKQNVPFIVLSNGYLMQMPMILQVSSVEKVGGIMNAHALYNTIYEDYGSYKPEKIAMRNIKNRHDSWMWKLLPEEDREPVVKRYSPALVLADQPNFGKEIREYLDLLFDNCIEFKLFQAYMSETLPESFTTRGKYIMHLVGQNILVEYDEVARVTTYTKGDYLVTTLIRDEKLF